MKFAYPEFLFAFAVLAIPIIIHLFNFKRYKTLYFSSLQFLQQIDEQTRSTQKLKHLLVLLLRLLAFSCLILAFAQPYVPAKSTSSTADQPVLALYLDNSFSMSALGANGTLLNQGTEVVRKLVKNAEPGTNFIFLTNELAGRDQRIITQNELLERIDQIDYSPIERKQYTPLNTLKEILDQNNYLGQRQYIIVSDFQENSSVFDQVDSDTSATYYPIQLVPQSSDNLFIDSVWFEHPLRRVNENNSLHVKVHNTSSQSLTNVEVNLNIDSYERTVLLDIPAQSSETVVINYSDRTTGLKSGKVEVNDQHVYFDDSYYFTYEVNDHLKVLIINGQASLAYPGLVFQTDPFYKVKEINAQQIQLSDFNEHNLIVLNSLAELSSGLVSGIVKFVEEGGSVVIIPSSDATISSYNQLLQPLELPIYQQKTGQGVNMNYLNYSATFFTGMFDRKEANINLPQLKAYFSSITSTRSNAEVLVGFENNQPFFVRNGSFLKAYAFYAGISEDFGKMHQHALFSALLLRTGELSQPHDLLSITLGNDEQFPVLRPSRSEGPVKLVKDELELIPPSLRRGAYDLLTIPANDYTQPIKAGIYSVKINQEQVDQLAVNYNRLESILTPLSSSEIQERMEEINLATQAITAVSDLTDIEQLSLNKPIEYWRILLILALSFLLIEMLLLTLWKL